MDDPQHKFEHIAQFPFFPTISQLGEFLFAGEFLILFKCATNTDNYISLDYYAGLSSLGVPEVPWLCQILADQLTLSLPGGSDYANHITTGTSRFSDLSTALLWQLNKYLEKHTGA